VALANGTAPYDGETRPRHGAPCSTSFPAHGKVPFVEVLLRADASATMGVGHLSRILTLAGALRRRGVRCVVATHRPDPSTIAWIERGSHELLMLNEMGDARELAPRAARASWIVVDGYHLDARYCSELSRMARVAVLDDLADASLHADLVLNGNLYGAELAYRVSESTRLLLGPRFALVREEFVAARAERTTHVAGRLEKARILVTMGGADPTRATEAVLRSLTAIPPASVRVAVGMANPRLDAILQVARDASSHDIEVVVGAPMGRWMAWCDAVVTAAGSTCLELACVGVAGVAVSVVANQRLVLDALDRLGLLATVTSPEDAAPVLAGILSDPFRRDAMERAQHTAVDGQGAARVTAELMSQGAAA
jgi:UDP-2,4-diacetamido-2,4,6-trideoxy-beta-L-altropyranose hydrolase